MAQRPRRPQLSDTINRLDEMIETLSTAIPGAVTESVREVLGTSLVTAIGDAVREAVREGVREGVAAAMLQGVIVPPPVTAGSPSTLQIETKRDVWARVRTVVGGLRRWAARRVAPVVARLALGWAIVRIVGGATVRSRSAALVTALSGAVAGLAGCFAGPIGAAILLGLAGGAITATATWAAPAVRLLVSSQDD